jgi:hypothetical protein
MALDLSRDASDETPEQGHAVDLKLHDETIQALYGVSLRLQAAAGFVSDSPDAMVGELDHALKAIDDVIGDLRERIEELTGQEHNRTRPLPPGYLRR